MLAQDLAESLPGSAAVIKIDTDELPLFETLIPTSKGSITISPPLDEDGRGAYVSNNCAPMASKKSFHSRIYHWSKEAITVVLAVRISYALNATQEWKKSAPSFAEQDAAARLALADFEELSFRDRAAADCFGSGAESTSNVWCYLTHGKSQLESVFRRGHGVIIVSPRACENLLRAIQGMGPLARFDNLYLEEVKALTQMLFTKVLPDATAIGALKVLAMERARRVFSFCADWLFDTACSSLMLFLVPDRPHKVFHVTKSRPHMTREICFFYEKGLNDAEAVVYGTPAFDLLFNKILACCLRHRDFSVWMHINYETSAVEMYAELAQLGIPALLITGGCDDDDKERVLTDFDKESVGKQVVISTAAVTVGNNFERNFSVCVVIQGPHASGPIEAGQSAGRATRSVVPECNFILWLIKGSPPKPDEKLTPLSIAKKSIEDLRVEKMRYANKSKFSLEMVNPLLLEVSAVNKAYELNKLSHCALLAHTLVDYKPGWTRVDPSSITLPTRLAEISDGDARATLQAAKPLPLDQIQKIDSLRPDQKMALGYTQLVTAVQEKYTSGAPDISYAMAEKDVLDTCSGMFKHPHLSDTFVRNLKLSGLDKQTIRAWKAARHFSKLSAFTAKQLLTVEKFEDQLNLSACHLSLGSRRVHLARTLLKSVADDGEKVGLYTRLPERIDGLEQACVLIGVSCLSVQNQTLTTDSPIVRLLQLDKMGVADITVMQMTKRLRVLIDVIAGDARTGSTHDLWSCISSLLALICVEAEVTKDRKMTVEEQAGWQARNECQGGFLASQLNIDTAATDEADALLNEMFGEPSEAGSEPTSASTCTDLVELAPLSPATKRQKKDKGVLSKVKLEGAALRVPTEIQIHRRVFFFEDNGDLLDARKGRCVEDGVYTPANPKKGIADQVTANVTGVDFVPQWRVFSAELGDSIATRALLGRQMPLAKVEHDIAALTSCTTDEAAIGLTDEQRTVFLNAAKGQGIKRSLHVTETDGCVYMNEPIPVGPFNKQLQKLRKQKQQYQNRLCNPKLLEQYEKASKSARKRIDREYEAKVMHWMGPKSTSQLQWLEAVDEKAAAPAGGIRWLQVVYQKKMGIGRLTPTYPSLCTCQSELRRKLMKSVAHDWDIVSCHNFLGEAVVRGFLKLNPEEILPTLYRYNCSRAADVLAGRDSSENMFLNSIAEWYGVSVGEAKFGPLVVLNQGTIGAWLKDLDPPRQAPAKGDHPDLISLSADALVLRKLFFKHADELFPHNAFEGLKTRLCAKYADGSLESTEKMEKKLFSYCMQHFESVALKICTDVSARYGLPPLTFIYDGFLQLHVEGNGAGTSKAVKRDAESALKDYFKSPIYLTEKAFYDPSDEDGGIDEDMIISPAGGEGVEERTA